MIPFHLVRRDTPIPTDLAVLLLAATIPLTLALLLSFQAGVFTALFLILAWWTWHNPQHAFFFLIITAPILPAFKITQTIGTLTLLKDIIILTLFVKTVALPLLTKQLPYRRNQLFLPILMLIAWVALNTLRADELVLGIVRARDIVLYILLFLAVLYLPGIKQLTKRTLTWFLVSATIVIGLAAYQWFIAPDSTVLRFDPSRQLWIPRLASIMAHPSIFGHYLVTLLAILTALATTLHNIRWRWYAGIAAVATLVPLFFTYTRASWIAAVVVLITISATLLITHRAAAGVRQKLLKPIPILIALIVVSVLGLIALRATPLGTFARTAFDPTYASNAERLEFAARLIAPMTNTEALIGRGLGDVLEQNFREVDVSSEDLAAVQSRTVQLAKDRTLVDNQYLKTFVELGLFGLLIYAWLYGAIAITAFKQLNDKTKSHTSAIGTLGFLAAFLVQALFIDIWDIFPTNLIFWVIAALLIRSAQPLTLTKEAS